MEAVTRASIVERLVSGLESTLSSSNTCIRELELHLASKILDFDAATPKLEPTGLGLISTEDAVSLEGSQMFKFIGLSDAR